MVKKPTRSTANDASTADSPAVPKPRARAGKLNRTTAGPGPSGVEGPEKISDALAARPLEDPTDEEIRARAFEMYLERGGHHGLDFDDWVRAERELRQKR
jgi:hypothetical protein